MPWSPPADNANLEMTVALSRGELIEHILEVIQSESHDQAIEVNMATTVESLSIDSVDVINILFRLEDEYKVSIDLDLKDRPETIGDLVNLLIEFIPHADDPK
jgi:acyl carrier protein